MADDATPPVRPRVLVADDERVIADTLGIILHRSGYEVTAVYSGDQAVQTAQTWLPDLFLADVVMPGMNGIEAAIRIRQLCPQCCVLLLSGQAATNDLLHDARLRGHHFDILAKPVHPGKLLARIGQFQLRRP